MGKPTKRTTLNVLTVKRLASLCDAFEVDRTGLILKDDLVDVLARAKRAGFAELLEKLSRQELKTICQAHGLDDSGREKDTLLERILGRGQLDLVPSEPAPAKPRGRPKKAKDAEPELADEQSDQPAENGKMTQQKLESHLWGAANILRGSIDAADFKHYIFGLLFYKRLCDVWQEEYEQRLAEFGDEDMAADPEEHRFDIPSGHSWDDVRKHTTNIGEHLNMAFHAIEDANFRLRGIFQDVDFNNKERFPDAVLERLLQHFEKHRLRHADVEDDVLGNAYEYLIAKFADDAGKKGGEFYTPKMVVRLMVECLQPEEGMSVYDPTCGSGGMLLEAIAYLKRKGKDHRALMLYGQERNLNTWAICKMNMFLHGIDDVSIERGDTLRDPKHLITEGGKVLMTFDRVLANPPFSLKEWGHEQWSKGDKFGRDTYGCPPASYGDLAFVQHMLASLKPRGAMAVVVPHGVLFRGGTEATIRRGIIESNLLDAIVSLAPNLFYGTGIPACIWLLRQDRPSTRKGKLLFIDGANEFTAATNQNLLEAAHVTKVVTAYREYKTVPGFSHVASIQEITDNDYNLNIPRYIHSNQSDEGIDLRAELRILASLREQRNNAEDRMLQLVKELDLDL
jgi:type I restriction enzyme M protein